MSVVLRLAGGFEGSFATAVNLDADDLSVPDPVEVRNCRLNGRFTSSATAVVRGYHEHHVAKVPCLLDIKPIAALETAEPVRKPPAHGVRSPEDATLEEGIIRNHEFDVIGPVAGNPREVPLVCRTKLGPDDCKVLLRHRPRSIPQAQESA